MLFRSGIGQIPSDAIVEALIEVNEEIPFVLHKVAGTFDQRYRRVIGPSEVRECFEDFIDDPDEFRWFEHYLTRVGPYYGERASLAERVLRATLSETNDWISTNPVQQTRARGKEYQPEENALERTTQTTEPTCFRPFRVCYTLSLPLTDSSQKTAALSM